MQQTGEKTEKATQHRLVKARREGKFASSKDFVSGLQFTVFVILLVESGQQLLGNLKQATRTLFSQAFRPDLSPAALTAVLHQSFAQTMYPLAATSGVLVNAVAPAVIATPMNDATSPEVLAHITSLIPMRRVGPSRIGCCTTFLRT